MQREILAHLGTLERDEFGHHYGTTVWKLTKAVFKMDDHEPTAAQLESVRRAVRSLKAAEKIVTWSTAMDYLAGRRTYKQRVHYHHLFDQYGRPLDPGNTSTWERTVQMSERYVSLASDPTPEEATAWEIEKAERDAKFEHLMAAIKARKVG